MVISLSIADFGVSGFLGACNYTLSITDSVDCPNSCSGNGQCFEGTCTLSPSLVLLHFLHPPLSLGLCNSGYSGDDCSVNQVTLTPGNVISGSVASGEWMYYALRLPASASVSSITIALHETSSTGSVWVYAVIYSVVEVLFPPPHVILQICVGAAHSESAPVRSCGHL